MLSRCRFRGLARPKAVVVVVVVVTVATAAAVAVAAVLMVASADATRVAYVTVTFELLWQASGWFELTSKRKGCQ